MGVVGKGGGPGKGGNGGGGKKGGGKKKGGGGGSSGKVAFCFSKAVLDTITAAFNGAVTSKGLSDGCLPGLMKVTMDVLTAQQLLTTIALGLNTGGGKKKKKKGKAKLSVVGGPKTPPKGRKAG